MMIQGRTRYSYKEPLQKCGGSCDLDHHLETEFFFLFLRSLA